MVYQGRDPRGGEMPTFAEAAERVIRLHSKTWKPGSRLPAQWRQTLSDYAYPTIGQKRVNRIVAADVMTVLSPIWSSKPSVARVVRQRIGAVMKWAVAKGYRQDNPAGDAITSALPRGSGHVHHRALPHAQVGETLQAVRTSSSQRASRLAFEFVALTACRGIEVCGARWREMDLEHRVWTIPATRMKSKREHRVPLSESALPVLHAARDLSRGDLVFPGMSSDNQDENVATIKVRTRGRDATSARTMAVAGKRGKWERGERDGGHASACSADSGVFPRPRRGERSEPGRGRGRRILRGIGVG